ncbi:MAG: ribonuclease R [Phycisphaerae bacterium]|nr:ribonuclease R [Phycisphaerae bacterium]
MERLKKQILTTLTRRDYTPLSTKKLAQSIGVSSQEYPQFQAALEQLRQNQQVVVDARKNINLPTMGHRVIGTFRANARGFGFVIPLAPNAYGDLYVSPEDTAGAMNNDTVVARAVKKGHRDGQMRYSGIIIDIIERGSERFVGTLVRNKGLWMVQPEGKGFFPSILVDDAPSSGAKENDKVVLEIVSFPTEHMPGRGAIVEVLGRAGQYDAEIRSIIARYGLPAEFDTACRDQARLAAENFKPDPSRHRSDITDKVIVTIDPPDARDFDDAISLKKDKSGNWQLGVHIADVSHFIPQESALDKEARLRGNSVYLPRKVIPMLPEVLSNGICSLQPGQKRFAKSALITYDAEGNVLGAEFDNSIICSRKRLTYLEVDAILKGKAKDYPGEVVALLKDMEQLARTIEKRREKNGMLHLDLPETELVYDEKGRVIDAHPADDSYPHTMIEMFMVEANEAVAGLLDRFGVPFMRRIHPDPDAITSKNLGRFVKICGLKVPRHLNRNAIQDLLAAVKNTPLSYALNMHVLRSMQKAEYSPLHIGHFALASTHYCHFTSPIRRYADLLVHRLIDCYVHGKLTKIGLDEVLSEGELIEIGKHITFTELQAADAEKELKTVLILQMLSERIGQDMDVVVSGLTNFGIFVQCMKFGIEGLIEPGDLGLDEWKFDERAQAVVGKWSGESVHLGQLMKVRIAAVNVAARQLFLAPAEPLVKERPTINRRKFKRKHHTHKKSRR